MFDHFTSGYSLNDLFGKQKMEEVKFRYKLFPEPTVNGYATV